MTPNNTSAQSKFEMVDKVDTDRLINQTALRDMQIKSYWEGAKLPKMNRRERIEAVCERFGTGYKNVEKIVKDL